MSKIKTKWVEQLERDRTVKWHKSMGFLMIQWFFESWKLMVVAYGPWWSLTLGPWWSGEQRTAAAIVAIWICQLATATILHFIWNISLVVIGLEPVNPGEPRHIVDSVMGDELIHDSWSWQQQSESESESAKSQWWVSHESWVMSLPTC